MRKIFLDDLPRYKNTNKVDWNKAIGSKVSFIYNEVQGEIELLSYDSKCRELTLKYNERIEKMNCIVFKQGNIGKVLGRYDFKFEIGDIVVSLNGSKRKIVDRYKDAKNGNRKTYKCKCLECGAIYDVRGTILNKQYGCGVCANQVCSFGINDIFTKNPEYIKYFENPEDAKKVTLGSCNKVKLKCPICGYKKEMKPEVLKRVGFRCNRCNDGISYPNKIMSNLLKYLNLIFEAEYSPNWACGRRYDFRLYVNHKEYILEMQGGQHYFGGFERMGGRNFDEEIENDKYKEKLAKKNGFDVLTYIIIDCRKSEINYIKNSILTSRLNEILNLEKVDWVEIDKKSQSSIINLMCEHWQKNKSSSEELSKVFGIGRSTVSRYLKKGAELKLCDYNSKEIKRDIMTKKLGKPVIIKKENVVIGEFRSCAELERQSSTLYGVKLFAAQISKHALDGKIYKGYLFQYAS